MAGMRAASRQCRVTQQACNKQQDHVSRKQEDIDAQSHRHLDPDNRTQQHQSRQRKLRYPPRREADAAAEGEDERREIDGQRNSPDQRHRRQVDGDVGGHDNHEPGRNERRRNPEGACLELR